MIAIYSADRAWRAAVEQQCQAHGVAARTASRPAELAKCLVDGAVRVVLADTADSHAQAAKVVATHHLILTSPGETTESVVRRAMEILAAPEG